MIGTCLSCWTGLTVTIDEIVAFVNITEVRVCVKMLAVWRSVQLVVCPTYTVYMSLCP